MRFQLKEIHFRWLAVGTVVLTVAYCQSLERPFLDGIDAYEVLDAKLDPVTGKIVELGRLYNFSSEVVEVGIYDSPNQKRDSSELHKPIFWVSSPDPYPSKVEYDGKCYFVLTEFRERWTYVAGSWADNETGKQICFYLLTPEGKRISDYQ